MKKLISLLCLGLSATLAVAQKPTHSRTVCRDGDIKKAQSGNKYVCHFDSWELIYATVPTPSVTVLAPIPSSTTYAMDVPAVSYMADTGLVTVDVATNILKPIIETRYKCEDSARVLLTSENGNHHCILFPPQESALVKGDGTIDDALSRLPSNAGKIITVGGQDTQSIKPVPYTYPINAEPNLVLTPAPYTTGPVTPTTTLSPKWPSWITTTPIAITPEIKKGS